MPTVTLDREFFQREWRRLYDDPIDVLAAEPVQNAVDAGATRLHVDTSDHPHPRLRISDDGHGMDRDTIENVFFSVGSSRKHTSNPIGGNGRARIPLCFAQQRYHIRTQWWSVDGRSGEYHIHPADTYHHGCRFDIHLALRSAQPVADALRRVTADSTLPTDVYLNGQLLPQTRLPRRARRVLRDPHNRPWARVYHLADHHTSGAIIVRSGGLRMFTHPLATDDTLIVELEPSHAHTVLTATRDRLTNPHQQQLHHLAHQLTSNRRAALTDRRRPLDRRATGDGFRLTPTHQPDTTPPPRPTTTPPHPPQAATPTNPADTRRDDGPHHRAPSGDHPSVYLFADHTTPRVTRLARRWDPQRWDHHTGARRRRLLAAWTEACRVATDALVRCHPEASATPWTVGWTFDPDDRACHRTRDGGHVLALNPVDDHGRTRYHLSRADHRRELVAIAAHEACHIVHSDHDERYASLLTRVMAAIDAREADQRLRRASRRTHSR